MTITPTELRYQFFDYLFGNQRGYVCICTAPPKNPRTSFKQEFFAWPEQNDELAEYVNNAALRANVWFGVNLLSRMIRKKEYCVEDNLVWCDVDTCDPKKLEPTPTVLIESSPGRYQAIWKTDQDLIPEIAEDYSKRIAYKYRNDGADPTGWDLTQLLRVPFTYNYKYQLSDQPPPQVRLIHAYHTLVPVEFFEAIEPAPVSAGEVDTSGMPDIKELPPRDMIEYKYWLRLRETAYTSLMGTEPDLTADWSKLLWRLINICIEAGMLDEEVFACVLEAKCNKYARDNRPPRYLWRDILKASLAQKHISVISSGNFVPLSMPRLVDAADTADYIVDEYKKWGEIATDAVPAFHELAAIIVLSSLIAENVTLEASYGTVVPNLWGLVLGDSTLTRKTTAMRMATDFLQEMEEDIVIATDGSAEGLLSALSTRPSRVSLYYRDEVSGFFDSINRKDYLAGMPEILTHLYDVPRIYKRALRKEQIVISSPKFIFFGGGVREKVYSLITDEYILSGFLPRFLVVGGDADLSKIRKTGPASKSADTRKMALRNKFGDIKEIFNARNEVTLAGQTTTLPVKYEAELTDNAWDLYGKLEIQMVEHAADSAMPALAMPTFERLSRSMLKMSILLACSRLEHKDQIVQVNEKDVKKAASYAQDWGRHAVDLIINAGKTTSQRILDRVRRSVEREPGVFRSKIMQVHHLSKREADDVLGTLVDRGEVVTKRVEGGKGIQLWPT
jgi:hypothetical protein